MEEKKERTCFNCTGFDMCYLRHKFSDATFGAQLNIDGDSTPGRWIDIFKALANCCPLYYELMDVKFEKE